MNEELKVIIRAELAQFKQAMSEAISGLRKVASEGRKASKEIDGFTADVNEQGKALQDLKKKYIDLAAAHGKESKAAKDAAEQIKKLSAEYKTNKTLANDLANEANSFDASFGEGSKKNVDDTNESVQELQGSLEAIRNLDFAGVMLSAFGPELRQHLSKAKAEFEEMAVHLQYGLTGLFKNGRYYKETGEEWTGLGDAIKGAFESGRAAGQTFKNGMKEVGAAPSKALSGIVGVLLVVIADLLVLIGLTKNALSVAKEIKTMANQASKSGMDTSTYQEWGYVLKQVGIEEDKLSDFTKKLAERQNEVRDGSEEATKAFEALGISAEEAMGSSQEELFRKSVSALQNIGNEAERTSASFRLFSDDATDLTNLLYLTNQETQSLIGNYYALGAAPSDNLINKSKILGSSTQNLSYAWQGLKNTLAEWVIPAVIGVVQWLTTAIAYINVFLQGVFGVEMKTKKAADGMEAMGQGANNVASGATNATKAVKELLRYTMGFDELNVIPKQSSGSDSGSGSGAGSGAYSNMAINPELPVIEVPDMSKFRAFMDEYGSIIQGILTWSLIGIGVLLAVLGFMSGNIALGILGISLAGLGIGVGAAGGEESHWAKLGQGIKNVIRAIGDFFVDAWNWIVGIWNGAGEWFAGIWESIKNAFSAVGTWFKDIFTTAWNWVVDAWFAAGEWFGNIWSGIKTGARDAWNGVKSAFSSVGTWFKDTFSKAWEKVKNVRKDTIYQIIF